MKKELTLWQKWLGQLSAGDSNGMRYYAQLMAKGTKK